MPLTAEHVGITNQCLRAAFGDTAPVARLDDEQIAVDLWTISVEEKPDPRVPDSYTLDVGVPVGGRDEPGGVDIVLVYQDRGFAYVVRRLAEVIAAYRVDIVLDRLAADQFVKDKEEDDRLAQEYFRSERGNDV